MTTPRQYQWYTDWTTNNEPDPMWDHAAPPTEGTIQRIIGAVQWRTDDDPPPGQFQQVFGFNMSVGTASVPNFPVGADDPELLFKRVLPIINTGAATVSRSPLPDLRFDIESQRIINPGESLWLRTDTQNAAVEWVWTFHLRVLVLLP